MPARSLHGFVLISLVLASTAFGDGRFVERVAPLLERHCLRCHQGDEPKGEVDLSRAAHVVTGRGEDGWVVVPGKPGGSRLLEVVTGDAPEMPKGGDPLTAAEVAILRKWIADGAPWPKNVVLHDDPLAWWSLQPLTKPPVPQPTGIDDWGRNAIDAFVLAELREQDLSPSPEADRRTLIRRLSFDLVGLPPAPERVERFVNDPDPRAYEKLVDELLDSPGYGERWARHWLDVVHYGDTHGFDKDKVRPNAWPYRDYVIRSLNEDKPYSRFVREQLAGDHFFPGTRDGIVGLGFIAAGPFDFVGQIEVGEGTMEKRRVRNLDRDDMVATTMNTFVGLTAQCARCHDHKFDPIRQSDYYALQAVFAAVDRADRPYDVSPEVSRQRTELAGRADELQSGLSALDAAVRRRAGPRLKTVEGRLAVLRKGNDAGKRPEFGYHSSIVAKPDVVKWVQVDLGKSRPIDAILYAGCHDDFAGIGAGFGFPVRFRIELGDDPNFREGVIVAEDRTRADVPNPGIEPQIVTVGKRARYVRVTATKLAERKNDFIFALAELAVLDADGENLAAGAKVTALDSIEAPVRWRKTNLVDGLYRGLVAGDHAAEATALTAERAKLIEAATDEATKRERKRLQDALADVERQRTALPGRGTVYAAATTFARQGAFVPTLGQPRPVHLLNRGDVKQPLGEPVVPGTIDCLPDLASRFEATVGENESARRAALAAWIVDRRNPLTWRTIVNRTWHYHFGRGFAATPNDLGRMGTPPTHPELLDWLAVEFRDGRQSLKDLHRLIVTSATYRQASSHDAAKAKLDAGNRFLWRMNRRKLEAEAIRDGILSVSGSLDRTMGGPGFRVFGFKNDHSPHYEYQKFDPNDPATHRRSIYRFLVRSVPDPFMTVLDCADPSQVVPARNETLTALQALALLNNGFTVAMADRFAKRLETEANTDAERVRAAIRLAFAREAEEAELRLLVPLAEEHGLPSVCRLIFNTSEFLFVD